MVNRLGLVFAVGFSLLAASGARAQTPLTTAFTYQGELASAGGPATGTYDIRFRVFDAASGGTQIGSTLCSDNLAVANGRFSVSLDFGAAAFAGQQRFVEIEVRQDAGLGCSNATGYTLLTPRQELTATPNATFAQSAATASTATTALTASNATSLNGQSAGFYQNAANLTGTVADARLSSNIARLNSNQTFTGLLNFTNVGNTFTGSGAGLTNLNGGSVSAGTLLRSALSADVQSGVGTLAPDLSSAVLSVATGSGPRFVTVSGSFAYVVGNSDTLQLFNISNPLVPQFAGSVATGSAPSSVAVSGSFVYVVNSTSNTLQVFNISIPASPTLAATITTGNAPSSVAVSGPFAYLVNSTSNTLQVFNISIPASPTLAATITTGNAPSSVAVSGPFAYVANALSNTLQVFNISSPVSPTLAGSVTTGIGPVSVTVSGSFAYVSNGIANMLQVFNISNPAAPTLAGSVATGSQPFSVAVSGSLAYVVNQNSNTLQGFDISNPAAPSLIGTVATGNSPFSVAASGSYAYVVNTTSNTLQVFSSAIGVRFSSPLVPSSLAGVNGSGLIGVNASSLNGQTPSFYTNASNITTGTLATAQVPSLDASKITSGTLSAARIPNLDGSKITTGTLARSGLSADVQSGVGALAPDLSIAGSIATGIQPNSVAISGSFAYALAYDTLKVYNISSPAAPTLVGSIGIGGISVAVSGSFAYVATGAPTNILFVVNVNNPAAPTLVGQVLTGDGPISVAASGSFAYVVNFSSGTLQVFNVSNPAAPTLAGSLGLGGQPWSVTLSGSFAYVANRLLNRLQVCNISNPAAPTLAGSVVTGTNPQFVAVSGSIAYVANGTSNTLQVFDVTNPAAPTLAGSVATGNNPQSIAVSGSFAYVVNRNSNTLQVFDVSNSTLPTLVGSVATGIFPSSVALSGSVAYVANNGSNTLQFFNAPVRLGFGTLLAASSLNGVNGSGLIGVNATSLNGQVASFYTNASNISTGTLANAQTTGTNLNAANTLVLRDASGNFSAGTITAALSGNATSATTATDATQLNGQIATFYTNASNMTTGTLSDLRLSTNIPLKNAANAFTSPGITSFAGNVGIGRPDPSARLHIAGGAKIDALNFLEFGAGIAGKESNAGKIGYQLFSTSLDIIGAGTSGSNRTIKLWAEGGAFFTGGVGINTATITSGFMLDVAGSIRCVTLTQTSSREFKKDIAPLTGALESIMKLRGVTYAWNEKAPEQVRGAHDIGFIADEMNEVLPEIVAKDAQGKALGIDYGKITPVTVEAIKQLKCENDDLRARLAALEAAVAKISANK